MKKFILLYKGPATPMEEIPEEKGKEIMSAWQKWMENIGDSIVDIGTPMANGRAIYDDGADGEVVDISGYTIVQANSMDDALKMVENHPFLIDKTGDFSVQVFECVPIEM